MRPPIHEGTSAPALKCCVALALLCASGAVAAADSSFYFAVDVPTTLGGAIRRPNEIIAYRNGTYSLEAALFSGVEIGALHYRADGAWLFAPRTAVSIGGNTFRPADVVAYDGANYVKVFDGAASGVPNGVRIDAVMTDDAGRLVVSFDAPVKLSGTNFGMSDLVRFDGTFTTFWSGGAAGVPPETDVRDAGTGPSGQLIVSFDIPTTVGSEVFLPGDLVAWSGEAFERFQRDASWSIEVGRTGLAFLPAAGAVPGGGADSGEPLRLDKTGPGQVQLSWGASCLSTDSDYEVYEGNLGDFSSHVARRCSTGGARSATITPSPTSDYYLVVPRNAVSEGSYGATSAGTERPVGPNSCLPRATSECQPGRI